METTQIRTHLIIKNYVLSQILAKERVAIADRPSHGARWLFVTYALGWGGRRGEFWGGEKNQEQHENVE